MPATEEILAADFSDLALLRSIQNRVSWRSREAIAHAIAQATRERMATDFTGGADRERLDRLRRSGFCPLPLALDPHACGQVREYFERTPCYAAHVPAYSDGSERSVDTVAASSNYGSYRLDQSLVAPHMMEILLDPRVLDLVGGYLGCAPSLYSVNTFWTFPSSNAGLSHFHHRDEDDYRFVVVFIYWTDVVAGEGEFYFIEGTHDCQTVEKRLRYNPWPLIHRMRKRRTASNAEELRRLNGGNGYGNDGLYWRLFDKHTRCIEGKAGTAIAADTFGLHRGALPRSRRRLCTWIRYGLYANEAYRIDKTEPAPASLVSGRVRDDATTRYITRLVLDWTR